MSKTKKQSSLLFGISCLGILFGLLVDNGDIPIEKPDECRIDAVIGFTFFCGCTVLAETINQFVFGVRNFFARVARRLLIFHSDSSKWNDPILHYMSFFFVFLGIGLTISALWRDSNRIWAGVVFFSGGGGIWAGRAISKGINKKFNARGNL